MFHPVEQSDLGVGEAMVSCSILWNNLILVLAKRLSSTQLSTPQIAPQMVMTMISESSWSRVRSIRGSGKLEKCSTID
jgi:hypothetical protein